MFDRLGGMLRQDDAEKKQLRHQLETLELLLLDSREKEKQARNENMVSCEPSIVQVTLAADNLVGDTPVCVCVRLRLCIDLAVQRAGASRQDGGGRAHGTDC